MIDLDTEDLTLETAIRKHTLTVLDYTRNNKHEAARLLGVSVKSLYNWLRKWDKLAEYSKIYSRRQF